MKITIAMSDVAIAKELFERLENIRQARGISQEELVKNLGISRPTYARLQKGTCSFATFISVLRELNLLEGLDTLVPVPSLRPSEVANAHISRHIREITGRYISNIRQPRPTDQANQHKSHVAQEASDNSVKAMLANRKNEGKK